MPKNSMRAKWNEANARLANKPFDDLFEEDNMKLFYNTSFTGHYPIGTSAIIWAKNKEEATETLNQELLKQGLPADAKVEFTYEFSKDKTCLILNNGDY